MTRRQFIKTAAAVGTAPAVAAGAGSRSLDAGLTDRFELAELTIRNLRRQLANGARKSQSLVEKYLERIAGMDRAGPILRYVLETNPDALADASAADRELKLGRSRGALHGIPILLKDNLDTAGKMTTTAGSLALEGSIPKADAFVVSKLRSAGAILLGKANLSEWANFRSTHSSSGWSSRGGQAKNPYALDRNPSGSSSGSAGAVAVSFCAAAVGTETDGSVVCPASCCGIVGVKPTVGLLSRSGIIPISKTQDTAGPMARTVEDAAILLGAMVGVDVQDPATRRSEGKFETDYTRFLNRNALKGAKIGVARSDSFAFAPPSDKVLSESIAVMKSAGAQIVDPIDFAILGKLDDAELTVMLYEFKTGINTYLAGLGGETRAWTLADLIAFNKANSDRTMPFFGQELFEKAQAKGSLRSPEYLAALEKCSGVKKAIDTAMEKHHLDALVAITAGPPLLTDQVNGDYTSGNSSTLAAVPGYPSISVPAGFSFGLPIGISFTGRAFSETTLIGLAYAFEHATGIRKPPRFLPTADLSRP
ncbi:MAG TPA: amidase [Tepidisphaeraceae bacterium]|nr:amidase [Tepidisphaeraceae bacterium]